MKLILGDSVARVLGARILGTGRVVFREQRESILIEGGGAYMDDCGGKVFDKTCKNTSRCKMKKKMRDAKI